MAGSLGFWKKVGRGPEAPKPAGENPPTEEEAEPAGREEFAEEVKRRAADADEERRRAGRLVS